MPSSGSAASDPAAGSCGTGVSSRIVKVTSIDPHEPAWRSDREAPDVVRAIFDHHDDADRARCRRGA